MSSTRLPQRTICVLIKELSPGCFFSFPTTPHRSWPLPTTPCHHELFSTISDLTIPYFLTISDHFWPYLTNSDQFWPLLTTPYHLRLCSTTIFYIYPIQIIYNHFWPFPTISDHFRPFSTTFDHFWPLLTTPTPPQLCSTTIFCNYPLLTIYDHFRPFPTISDHFRPLPTIIQSLLWIRVQMLFEFLL